MHKSGFVNIIGSPNVGKSTLINALIGEKLSVITSKAQTTRHRIIGILNADDYQVVFSDTPGIIKPAYKLQQSMMKYVGSALVDADIMLYVTDATDDKADETILKKLIESEVPVFLVINKIDACSEEKIKEISDKWKTLLPSASQFSISALEKTNLESLLTTILDKLPESPPFYPKDQFTDKNERFFVSEIIRGKILQNYHKELPYSSEVAVLDFKETEKIIRIRTEIYVERESQKAIIIGHQGSAIKQLGIDSRKDIEEFFQKQVFLELFVKVKDNWRNSDNSLKMFGYDH